jgi:isoleucyl-tRNA synthetase
MVGGDKLEEIDAWALTRTAELLERSEAAYGEYAFHKVYRGVYDFATVEMSKFYLDILKDRLYTAPAGSVRRRAAQTVLYRIADAIVRLVAPLMCFTSDEIWTHLPAPQLREKSVHLAKFVSPADLRAGLSEKHLSKMGNWPRLIELREEVLKALDVAREAKFIGGALEARVILAASGDLLPLLQEYRAFLPQFFIASQVEIAEGSIDGASPTNLAGLSLKIEKAEGTKCDRCWNYSVHVGEDLRYPTVCERCSAALKEIEAAG